MKFIYKLDSDMSPMCASNENYDMDYEDQVQHVEMSDEDMKLDYLNEKINLMEDIMVRLSTCPTVKTESNDLDSELKAVDTDDVVSANGHYTLEDFFSNYNEVNRNESIDEVSETDLDFSKLFGNFEEPNTDNTFQSLIDLVKCEIPENLPFGDKFAVDEHMETTPLPTPPENETCKLVVRTEVVHTRPRTKAKKARRSPVLRPAPAPGTKLVEKKEYVNNRKVDYGANDTIENIYDLEWHPGFTRHLGAKGRSALLELVRRVYRQDPEHYKAILQSRNSPSSISSLPFYSIPMLWELAHQFGIFKQALTVYKNHCFAKAKSNKYSSFNKNSQTSASSDSSENQDLENLKRESGTGLGENPKVALTTMSGRLVKRSKKVLEYTPDHVIETETITVIKTTPKSQLSEVQPTSPLVYNHTVKDELSGSPMGSQTDSQPKTETNEPESETPLFWKLSVVNGHPSFNERKDGPLTPSPSLNSRIPV